MLIGTSCYATPTYPVEIIKTSPEALKVTVMAIVMTCSRSLTSIGKNTNRNLFQY